MNIIHIFSALNNDDFLSNREFLVVSSYYGEIETPMKENSGQITVGSCIYKIL